MDGIDHLFVVRQVFSTDSVTAYWIAYRSSELIENLLSETYDGWLMSDGYGVYRKYRNRLRCWAHLLRKAQGLKESLDRPAQPFGSQTLELLETLIAAIHQARSSPSGTPLTETFQTQLATYRDLCEQTKTALHSPTRALATELLNDWEAIFRILEYPFLPQTNNEAERALSHWVILRRICYGTRTEQGSRVFAILIAPSSKPAGNDSNPLGSIWPPSSTASAPDWLFQNFQLLRALNNYEPTAALTLFPVI